MDFDDLGMTMLGVGMIRSLNGISQKILHSSANYQDDCVSSKHVENS
jgi:hypothetical protein